MSASLRLSQLDLSAVDSRASPPASVTGGSVGGGSGGIPGSASVSLSLVREYLAAAGLTESLSCLKRESALQLPHLTADGITSRAQLAKTLGIVSLVRQNKEQPAPLASFLEVMVSHAMEGAAGGALSPTRSPKKAGPERVRKEEAPSSAPSPVAAQLSAELRSSLVRARAPLGATSEETSNARAPIASPGKPGKPSGAPRLAQDVLVYEDIEEDFGSSNVPSSTTTTAGEVPSRALATSAVPVVGATPLTTTQLASLRALLFGSAGAAGAGGGGGRASFSEEWRGKGFVFQEAIPYGLVQLQGGPCGVLAAVQALLLKHHLFDSSSATTWVQSLLHALAESLWQCRTQPGDPAILVLHDPGARATATEGRYAPDGMSEYLVRLSCSDLPALQAALTRYAGQFTQHGPTTHGLVQFVYSLLLTRGLPTVRADMDEPETTLIGRHNYCTQELVHLCLLGAAISNVFDGVVELRDTPTSVECKRLKGVPRRAAIGHLSLYEHYDSLKVGSHLKCPRYPIYVLCSESHYTVLFSKQPLQEALLTASTLPRDKPIDLYYYDQLAHQQEEIRLTLQEGSACSPVGSSSGGAGGKGGVSLVSPIEHCIRTKWPGARIDWNGTDPLL